MALLRRVRRPPSPGDRPLGAHHRHRPIRPPGRAGARLLRWAAPPRRRMSRVVRVDGIHDLGGMQGFGAVDHSPAEPVFHEPWEGRARALMELVLGAVRPGGGEFRHAIERMSPGHYLTSSYYEHWLTAAATLAVEHGLFTREDLEARAGG